MPEDKELLEALVTDRYKSVDREFLRIFDPPKKETENARGHKELHPPAD